MSELNSDNEELADIAESNFGSSSGSTSTSTDQSQNPSKKREREGPIYEYFEISPDGRTRCKAKSCNQAVMSLTTTVMKRHLERKHTILYREYKAKVG